MSDSVKSASFGYNNMFRDNWKGVNFYTKISQDSSILLATCIYIIVKPHRTSTSTNISLRFIFHLHNLKYLDTLLECLEIRANKNQNGISKNFSFVNSILTHFRNTWIRKKNLLSKCHNSTKMPPRTTRTSYMLYILNL